jgi:hypothetical protein
MKLVMTLLVRDEADIVDANIAFHLEAGVDFIIATDNASEDGTTEILEAYAHDGCLHHIRLPDRQFSQIEVVTRMARLAATDFGATWVINSDADEFWWPRRGGSLKDALAAVPPRFGCVRGMWRHFVPRPPGESFFAERMTARLCVPVVHKDHAFSPHFKTTHRADSEVKVGGGNHEVFGRALRPLVGWYPIDVLHFPLRSFEQCERKYLAWRVLDAQTPRPPDPRHQEAYDAYDRGHLREFYESHVVGDDALARGLRDGTLAFDTRLCDALRALGKRGESHALKGASDRSRLKLAEAGLDQGYLSELAALEDRSPLVRAQRRANALEARVSALETRLSSRLRARLFARGSPSS